MTIPKIIHQIWIGPKPSPIKLMNTWKEKNPDFEYIYWNEEEFVKRNMIFKCQSKIDEIEEINGKADILRWEILYKYGGVFLDADSICIEPIDDELLNKDCFAGWEQEKARPGLIATGTMGFPPKHPLVKAAIDWIFKNEVSQLKSRQMAWQTVGPGLLTRMYNTGKFNDLHIFPSYTFLPIHLTGLEYNGHGKIYAFQAWGSTKQSYDTMNNLVLPEKYLIPKKSVSVLVSSYNTKIIFIKECLDSIKNQIGDFNIELVWINDGSDMLSSNLLKKCIENFTNTTRFTSVIYHENEKNMGIGYSLNKGINLCNNEIIIKMDSDDIMVKDRILKQLTFMENNPGIMVCGGQVSFFRENVNKSYGTTNHPSITWDEYKKIKSHWISNHPTLCYRKSAIIAVGNYDINKSKMTEDFEITIRLLKRFNFLYNFNDVLLYYRSHENQVTHNGGTEGREYWNKVRNNLINTLIDENNQE
jgi:mannosyltransferase OCH1-like enzyme/GT2 family glycosyltransferase